MKQPHILESLSPVLKQIIIENILEKDLESFNMDDELTQEESEKVLGFLSAMELSRKRSSRRVKRMRVSGQFSNSVKSFYRSFNLTKNQKK
jgi:hypothetical protein